MGYLIEPIPIIDTEAVGISVSYSNTVGLLSINSVYSAYYKIYTINNQQFYLYSSLIQIGILNNIAFSPISFTIIFNTLPNLYVTDSYFSQTTTVGTDITPSTSVCEIGSWNYNYTVLGEVNCFAMVRNDTANFRFSTQFLFNL